MLKRLVMLSVAFFIVGCGVDELSYYDAPEPPPEPAKEETPTPTPFNEPPPEEDWCVSEDTDFDIEQVSVLEDAFGLPNLRDAVVLEYDASHLQAEETWRVRSVDVLAMIPDILFQYMDNSEELTIEVYDAASPLGTAPWMKKQNLILNDLDWEDTNVPGSSIGGFKRAWWRFDFNNLIPTTGMRSGQYIVGIHWPGSGEPTVGYSNYNRACDRNWTNSGSGFFLNSDTESSLGNERCSWPMLRVNIENRRYTEEICDE
jgi:hypothetical protein